MSSTLIDVGAVVSCSRRIKRMRSLVSGIHSSFSTTKDRIDNSIMDAELSLMLSQINNQFASLNNSMSRLSQTIEKSANAYMTADGTVRAWSAQIGREQLSDN